jgi:anti-sigma factor RsiW
MNGKHTDVGAYSLGQLEQRDRQAFEAHLADCPYLRRRARRR